MAGLDPAIHEAAPRIESVRFHSLTLRMDGPGKPGHDVVGWPQDIDAGACGIILAARFAPE